MHPESPLKQVEYLSAREHYINDCLSNEKVKRLQRLEMERLKKLQEIEDLKQTQQKLLDPAHQKGEHIPGNVDGY
jgi:hypothetical protein